jgi:hypothetical protein
MFIVSISQEINVCRTGFRYQLSQSSLLHLTGQPYWKKNRSAKVKDGIITYFLGTISLVDTKTSYFNYLNRGCFIERGINTLRDIFL